MQKGIIVRHGAADPAAGIEQGRTAVQAGEQDVAAGRMRAKPSLWEHALRVVRGEGTAELVERFTQEMTLVAEGICEDQARLRRTVDGLKQQAEDVRASTAQDMQCWQRRFDEQNLRIAALESSLQRLQGQRTPAC